MVQHAEQHDHEQHTTSASSQETSRDTRHELSQDELRRRYVEQQKRLACPGCGESPFLG